MNQLPDMMVMTVEELAHAVKGRILSEQSNQSPAKRRVLHVSSDSRRISPDTLFVAIAGEQVDGHDFVAQAADSGAVAALVEYPVDHAGLVQVQVPDTVRALGLLARHNIERRRALDRDFSLIGITGSVGKTTTKDLLASLLSTIGPTVAPVGSYNNEIGLPLTALQVGRDTRFLIAEMGANHVGEIARLTHVAPPDLSVVLRVGTAHLGEFGSVECITSAKSEIITGLSPGGVSVLNADDSRVSSMSRLAPGKVIWFGLDTNSGHSPLTAGREISCDRLGRPSFMLIDSLGRQSLVHLGISGRHNVMNALAAAAVAGYFGLEPDDIATVLSRVSIISPHRMALSSVSLDSGSFTLIDDSFNANPDSMKAGLDGLRTWRGKGPGIPSKVAVLGAMLELGSDEQDLHRQIGAYAAQTGIDCLIAVGSKTDHHLDSLACCLADGARHEIGKSVCEDREGLSVELVHDSQEVEHILEGLMKAGRPLVVLLKGSHASGLSTLASSWTGSRRNHELRAREVAAQSTEVVRED